MYKYLNSQLVPLGLLMIFLIPLLFIIGEVNLFGFSVILTIVLASDVAGYYLYNKVSGRYAEVVSGRCAEMLFMALGVIISLLVIGGIAWATQGAVPEIIYIVSLFILVFRAGMMILI